MKKRDKFNGAYLRVRPLVLERDGYRCVKCGWGIRVSLETHHVNGYEDNKPENIRTLCYLCHAVAPHGSDALLDGYWKWERSGVNGWNHAVQHLCAAGFAETLVRRFLILKYTVGMQYDVHMRDIDRRVGIARVRAATGRCEGQKPFGHFPGESEIIAEMRNEADAGETPAGISRLLNERGRKTRGGGVWHPFTVSRILARAK